MPRSPPILSVLTTRFTNPYWFTVMETARLATDEISFCQSEYKTDKPPFWVRVSPFTSVELWPQGDNVNGEEARLWMG